MISTHDTRVEAVADLRMLRVVREFDAPAGAVFRAPDAALASGMESGIRESYERLATLLTG